jgi:hypothetical protein
LGFILSKLNNNFQKSVSGPIPKQDFVCIISIITLPSNSYDIVCSYSAVGESQSRVQISKDRLADVNKVGIEREVSGVYSVET